MGIFRPRTEVRAAQLTGLADILRAAGYTPRDSTTTALTSPEQALRQSSVFACVDLISEQNATLPVDEYRKGEHGERVPLDPPSEVIAEPSHSVDPVTWRAQVFTSLLMRGNAFGMITKLDAKGWPEKVELIDPACVSVHPPKRAGDAFGWVFKVNTTEVDRWPHGPLWHVPGLTLPGSPLGLSPLGMAMRRVQLGLAAEEFGTRWFEEGGHPSAILSTEGEVDEVQAATIKQRFLEAIRGKREPVVLGAGITYEAISVPANESQFLETTQANVADIARYFRVAPELIGGTSGNSMTYANIEQRFLHMRQITLNPWLVRVERGLSSLVPDPRYVRFNRDAVVAVDLMTRYRAHDLALRGGWKSRDDIRKHEDEAPIPDGMGDEYLWPPYRAFPVASDDDSTTTE